MGYRSMSPRWESNPRPSSYQEDALPLSHSGMKFNFSIHFLFLIHYSIKIKLRECEKWILYSIYMAKEPDESPQQPPFLVYLKVVTLLFIFGTGIFLMNTVALNSQSVKNDKGSYTFDGLKKFLTKEGVKEVIDQEIRTNESYRKVTSEVGKKSEDILGEVTQIKDKAIKTTSESVQDYVYDQTFGAVIQTVLDRLPERQRQQVLENICKGQ